MLKTTTPAKSLTPLLLLALFILPLGCEDENSPTGRTSPHGLPVTTMTVADEVFTIELAYTEATRTQGLMYRDTLGANEGMLFIFADPEILSFYMRNCLIDLDIVFLDADGRIVQTTTMTAPTPNQQSFEHYSSVFPAQYALELPVGTCQRLNLQIGQIIQIPDVIKRITPESRPLSIGAH
ncbi:MAG: DUF192 domain-containing protein [Sedimentisphaerales bacterium]|nr:DUF192 domain-containing protein [Sedimentisphaerales bacterium]